MPTLKESNIHRADRLVWFYGISTIVAYLMPNPIRYKIKHQSSVYTKLNDQTVLFLIIQFSRSHLFALSLNAKQFYLTHR